MKLAKNKKLLMYAGITLVSVFAIILLIQVIDMRSSAQEPTLLPVNTEFFLRDGISTEITEEPCTLSNGTETDCYRISVAPLPVDHDLAQRCPRNISDLADEAGIWIRDGVVYDADGAFIENLANFYDDDNWQMYDPTDGSVNLADTLEACVAALQRDEAYANHCVECPASVIDPSKTLFTLVIPQIPVMADSPIIDDHQTSPFPYGVALNGVIFDRSAPEIDILEAYLLAPFDDCGGHLNHLEGYHYHEHTGCSSEVSQDDDHAPLIGYARDGVAMYAFLDANGEEPGDIDQCGGHHDDLRGYHYHVAPAGSNQILGCFVAEIGCVFIGDGNEQTCDASATEDE